MLWIIKIPHDLFSVKFNNKLIFKMQINRTPKTVIWCNGRFWRGHPNNLVEQLSAFGLIIGCTTYYYALMRKLFVDAYGWGLVVVDIIIASIGFTNMLLTMFKGKKFSTNFSTHRHHYHYCLISRSRCYTNE